jgi:hypothetical protein
MSTSDFSPDHRALPRIFANPKESQLPEITQLLFQSGSKGMSNASLESSDFLKVTFTGYDVIAAIECLYYLSASEQEAFFDKIAREHSEKTLIISGPIIGQNEHRRYFTHKSMLDTLRRHGISVIDFYNINVHRKTPLVNRTVANLAAALVRVPLGDRLLNALPDRLVYQRCYIAR